MTSFVATIVYVHTIHTGWPEVRDEGHFPSFEILGVVSKIEIAKRAMLLYLLFVGRHENDEVESGKYWLFKHACHWVVFIFVYFKAYDDIALLYHVVFVF